MPYDPDRSDIPYHGLEVEPAKLKPGSPFLVGGRVLYRHVNHGDVTDALVLDAADDGPKRFVDPDTHLVVDLPPWPTLTLDTAYGVVRCREARVRGSAGWLPLSWVDDPPAALPPPAKPRRP